MRLLLKTLLILILTAYIASASEDTTKLRVLIASTETGRNATEVAASKIYSAMNLVCELSQRYVLLTPTEVDSSLARLKRDSLEANAINVGRDLRINRIVFIKISRIANLLRADLVTMDSTGNNPHEASGWASLRYREEGTHKILYDPAMLKALLRAFAVAEQDSSMFLSDGIKEKIMPVPALAIGGMMFFENPSFRPWDIFSKKEIASFDALETIYDAGKHTMKYELIDTETRDSLYAIANLFMIENFNPPSQSELNVLEKLQIGYFISGSIVQTFAGASVKLRLCKIKDALLITIREEEGIIGEDSLQEMREVISSLTMKLLE